MAVAALLRFVELEVRGAHKAGINRNEAHYTRVAKWAASAAAYLACLSLPDGNRGPMLSAGIGPPKN